MSTDFFKGKENGQAEKHFAHRVVCDLLLDLDNTGDHVCMDNYYSDPHLFLELFQRGIHACGTICSKRVRFPKILVVAKREKSTLDHGHYRWIAFDQLLATFWFNGRQVYLFNLYTHHMLITFQNKCCMLSITVLMEKRSRFPPLHQNLITSSTCWVLIVVKSQCCKKAKKSLEEAVLDFCLELAAKLIDNQSFRKKSGRAPSLPQS